MKSPMLLWKVLAEEFGERCRVRTTQDWETVLRRSKVEGFSFLTIALPDISKDLEKGLADGRVDHTMFAGFRKHGSTPRFLGGFFDQIFDRSSGVLLDEPSKDAILAVRQLSRLYSKIELPCSDERTARAFRNYVQIESELEERQSEWTPEEIHEFSRTARILFGRVLSRMDFLCSTGQLVPKHGPGATADKLRGNTKFEQREWTWRLENGGFSSVDYLVPNSRYYRTLDRVEFLDPGSERPVKVISVPKTLKTPRIIAVEPTCMQYAQQALAEPLVELLERDSVTKGFIGFTDQNPNRVLAREGSMSGSLASLDLSEASDRVSNQLVEALFHGYTNLRDSVAACRSLRADVPGHGNIPLTKFASMGSALCFPIEGMVFLTLAFVGMQRRLNTRFRRAEDFTQYRGQVRVYGDDIIVPADDALSVIETLEQYAFKVNRQKSFWTGKFRESCGKDYYDGTDVSVVKCRREFPSSRADAEQVISMVSLRNNLHKAGFSSTVDWLDGQIREILVHFPAVHETSPVLGRHSEFHYDVDAWCPLTHRPLVRGYVVDTRLPESILEDEGALLKFFLKRGELPFADSEHLQRAGRPAVVDIKLRKAPAY